MNNLFSGYFQMHKNVTDDSQEDRAIFKRTDLTVVLHNV